MGSIISFFEITLYQPFFNGLILLYQYLPGHDFGIAIITLTVLIKLVLYPLGSKAIRSQKALSGLQPKVKELQKKYKDDKEKQGRAVMELYKKEKINPLSGCLPMLIQLPVLITLFWVFRTFEGGLDSSELMALYPFVSQPEINTQFLGLVDLVKPSIYLAFLAGIAQFFQTRMNIPQVSSNKNKGSDFASNMQKQMKYFFPIFTVFILLRLPAAIGLYWITTTLFTIIQQCVTFRNNKHD